VLLALTSNYNECRCLVTLPFLHDFWSFQNLHCDVEFSTHTFLLSLFNFGRLIKGGQGFNARLTPVRTRPDPSLQLRRLYSRPNVARCSTFENRHTLTYLSLTYISMMLCANCASIDLSEAPGPDPDNPVDPAFHRWDSIPKVFHYESYASIMNAAGSCQLCALLVEIFNAPASICPPLEQSIYRYVKRVRNSIADQARPLSTIIFGPADHSILHDFKGLDYCVVELYVDQGTLPVAPTDKTG
jgi:hypothetical protein